jgi:hypothetical protein
MTECPNKKAAIIIALVMPIKERPVSLHKVLLNIKLVIIRIMKLKSRI